MKKGIVAALLVPATWFLLFMSGCQQPSEPLIQELDYWAAMELLDGDRYLNPKEEDIVLVDFGYKPTQEKISKYGKEMVLCNSDFLKHYPDWWSKDKTIMGIPACLTLAGIADNGKYLLYYFIDGDKAIIVYAYNNATKEFDFFFVK